MKNVKTLVFAMLILSIVIPITGYSLAEADATNEVLENIRELKEQAKEQANSLTAPEDIDVNQKYLERLTLAEELITLQINDEGDSEKARELEQKLISELEKLPKTEMRYDDVPAEIGPGDTNDVEEYDRIYGPKAHTTSTNYDTSNVLRTDCSSSSYGDSQGTSHHGLLTHKSLQV